MLLETKGDATINKIIPEVLLKVKLKLFLFILSTDYLQIKIKRPHVY